MEFNDTLLPKLMNGNFKLFFQSIDSVSSEHKKWYGFIYKTK